jgi:hypothetical protein
MQTAPILTPPTFGPLVPTCRAHGIGRTKAFELAAAGLLDSFTVGTKRYVLLESLRTLPERLAAAGVAK